MASSSWVRGFDVQPIPQHLDPIEMIKSNTSYFFLYEQSILDEEFSYPDHLSFANAFSQDYETDPRSAGITVKYNDKDGFQNLDDIVLDRTVKEIIDNCFFHLSEIIKDTSCDCLGFPQGEKDPTKMKFSSDVGQEIVNYVSDKIWKMKVLYRSEGF